MTWGEEQAQRLSAADNRNHLEVEQSIEPFLRALNHSTSRFGHQLCFGTLCIGATTPVSVRKSLWNDLGDHLVRLSVEFNTAKREQILATQRSGTWVSVSTNRYPGGRIQLDYNNSKACVGVLKE